MIELGLIESFYGQPWPWDVRAQLMRRLARHGYRFHHYAPKRDPHVRQCWRQPWPDAAADRLRAFSTLCRGAGVRFGAGLSPIGLSACFDAAGRAALAARLAQLDAIGVDDLLLLFDDVRGDAPELAAEQARLVHWAAARSSAGRVYVCPTYYSDDPLLDRLFGPRPAGYLTQLGALLDPAIRVYWAGEVICPPAISPAHLARVSAALGRQPVLWDNYPVNDGERMSRHLHLRACKGRPAALGEQLCGHAINPALQPALTAIPAQSLAESYRLGPDYRSQTAFRTAAASVLGPALAAWVEQDLHWLQDVPVDLHPGHVRASLRRRYASLAHPAAVEIVRWLDGEYTQLPGDVPTA